MFRKTWSLLPVLCIAFIAAFSQYNPLTASYKNSPSVPLSASCVHTVSSLRQIHQIARNAGTLKHSTQWMPAPYKILPVGNPYFGCLRKDNPALMHQVLTPSCSQLPNSIEGNHLHVCQNTWWRVDSAGRNLHVRQQPFFFLLLRYTLHSCAHSLEFANMNIVQILIEIGTFCLELQHIALDAKRLMFFYLMPLPDRRRVCLLTLLKLSRNTMRRHDFLLKLQRLNSPLALSSSCCQQSRGSYQAGIRSPCLWHVKNHILVLFPLYSAVIGIHNYFTNILLPSAFRKQASNFQQLHRFHKHRLNRPTTRFLESSNPPNARFDHRPIPSPIGGRKSRQIIFADIQDYVLPSTDVSTISNKAFKYIDHVDDIGLLEYPQDLFVHAKVPLHSLLPLIPITSARSVARHHGIIGGARASQVMLSTLATCHSCIHCSTCISVFSTTLTIADKKKLSRKNANAAKSDDQKDTIRKHGKKAQARYRSQPKTSCSNVSDDLPFPPEPLDHELAHTIVSSACKSMTAKTVEEAGCAVCGLLTPVEKLSRLKNVKNQLMVLCAQGVTRVERKSSDQKIKEYTGPVLDYDCHEICHPCRSSIRKNNVPRNALARGLWIGKVPPVLSSLRYVERMLIARVRHTCCFVRVSSGMRKMKANAIAFESPITKIYACLPPPKAEMDDVLAILYTGPSKPSEEDFKRTPLLVRRNHVINALEWLKLNHCDYADIDISRDNMQEYPEDVPPVSVEYKPSTTNKTAEGTSVFDMEDEDGTDEGDCPFTVHGLTGTNLDTMSVNAIKARAIQHLNNQGKFLAIGQSDTYESMWNNPQLYPRLFPWLFPYGLGGIGSTSLRISDKAHKKHLMMYHDKRFQTDVNFPFVAFSHEQVKASASQSWLLADRHKFSDITTRLLSLDQLVLSNLTARMVKGESVKPNTDAEKACFQVIKDLDSVSGKVHGSTTSKKYMRNEIWSLISHRGAPSWYITLSPADLKHPICIYWADTKEKFEPSIVNYNERASLVCRNPAAGARFFDFVVRTFIEHVLGVGAHHRGLYGDTSAYYGTVEQQGRLTLHLHLLLWLRGCVTPQVLREKLMDPNSDWQKKIVDWLESCQMGEFMTGSKDVVEAKVSAWSKSPDYKDPTETMPEPPPPMCKKVHENCKRCDNVKSWWGCFKNTVDDILMKSNIHNCRRSMNKDSTHNKKHAYVGCLENKWGKCKARFPRPTRAQTDIDPGTGALNLKKCEPWMNNITPIVTYLFRCNTDVTCLFSGTAIKGVVLYVSDYITKSSLKTHVIFDSIKAVFTKNREMIGSSLPSKEKARQLMSKVVNLLSTKMEMGAPMICMYLLGNPDHYTDHTFIPFYWQSFVSEVLRAWHTEDDNIINEKIVLIKQKGSVIGLSPVLDYMYRSSELDSMTLYDWVRRCTRVKIPTSKKKICGKRQKKGKPNSTVISPDVGLERDQSQDISYVDSTHNIDLSIDSINTRFGENEGAGHEGNSTDISCVDSTHYVDLSVDSVNTSFDENEGTGHEGNNALPDCENGHKKLPKNGFAFTTKHPLFKTHMTKVAADIDTVVVNFLGASLPRCDHGDREYFGATMLTFFKPWRSGLDLKSPDMTWDEAFLSHKFESRQTELINNFNIRYECLDARDDYRAQMKRGGEVYPQWDEDVEHNLVEDENCWNQEDTNLEDDIPVEVLKHGKGELKRQREMATMGSVMKNAGWTIERPGSHSDIDLHPPNPLRELTGSDWSAEVQRKRRELIELRSQQIPTDKDGNCLVGVARHVLTNEVKVVDKSYLERRFHAGDHQDHIDTTVADFCLNAEQERAFRMVANHATSPYSDVLRLYIGGMGGTGKSQVLKALSHFFSLRNESHRFTVVAPTGSAAALVGGSTYHFMFGINDHNNNSNVNLSQVRSRLLGVDYVFLDEVSMLSARDLYKISARLARALNRPEVQFGGMNMIFAGDFAQLPPAIGGERVSLYSRTIGATGTDQKSQEEAIGKALWHQVSNVVILRQNMRQKTQTPEDAKLRTALENMRYKMCTLEDIEFLRSCISANLPGRGSVCDESFRNVSIITSLNVHKDAINNLGAIRFANETGQSLTHFYSEDTAKVKDSKSTDKPIWGATVRRVSTISESVQQWLWEQPHSATAKQIPGKLSLCVGMPIMIRCNVATELCMTKGQEGMVHGWRSVKGSRGQEVLDTLFVKLTNPPSSIQFDGLDKNVIPLSRTSNTLYCSLPDGSQLHLTRSQVEVLPNFSMTDFASQGKSRINNVVDLHNSRSHQSYYTALSRSTSAAGTCILQGFDTRKITGGASGSLRQEFRELELLDEITKLRFEGKLHKSVSGNRRNELIDTFRQWKGLQYVPQVVHKAIRWSSRDPFLEPTIEDLPWQIIDSARQSAKNANTTATLPNIQGGDKTAATLKRKLDIVSFLPSAKRLKSKQLQPNPIASATWISTPIGTTWSENSCAYDSVISILHAVWMSDPTKWTTAFGDISIDLLGKLALGFVKHTKGMTTLEAVRDTLRRQMNALQRPGLKWGELTSLSLLLEELLTTTNEIMKIQLKCLQGHPINRQRQSHSSYSSQLSAGANEHPSVAEWIRILQEPSNRRCNVCQQCLVLSSTFSHIPNLLCVEFHGHKLQIDDTIYLYKDGVPNKFMLKGIIYHGNDHFISRIVVNQQMTWVHDGVQTGQDTEYEGLLYSLDLMLCRGKEAVAAIYGC
jgi:hypothetical protein